MLLFARGSVSGELNDEELREGLYKSFEHLGARKKVLAIPPDFTRAHSKAGELTRMAYEYYRTKLTDILPALGTHLPMTGNDIYNMYEIKRWKYNQISHPHPLMKKAQKSTYSSKETNTR